MSEWKDYKIKEIAETYAGGTPSRANPEFFGGDIPFISSSEVNQSYINSTYENITELGLQASSAKWIPPNSVLVALYGATAGQVAKLKISATSNQAVLAVIPHCGFDVDYIYYSLIASKDRLLYLAQGSGQPNLSKETVDKTILTIPISRFEQRKIAHILSTVDAVIEKTEAAIAKYESIKKGMMADLFTRGIDPATGKLRPRYEDAPELYQETELGWVPKDWEVESVKSLSIGGLKNGYFKKPELVGRGLELVNVTDLYQPFRINIYEHKVERVEASQEDYVKYAVAPGDIFFTRSSLVLDGIAHCNISVKLPEKAIYECHVMRLRPNQQKINPLFLAYFCRTHYARRYFMTIAKQVTMVTISQPDIEKFLVAFPRSIKEQEIIAGKIQSCDDNLCNERVSLKKYNNLKQGLMADLLTGRVRVQVAVEPAAGMAEVSNG